MSTCITPTGLIVLAVNAGALPLDSVSNNHIIKDQKDLVYFEELYTNKLDDIFQFLSQLDAHGP